jgi:hypothetical protein
VVPRDLQGPQEPAVRQDLVVLMEPQDHLDQADPLDLAVLQEPQEHLE